MSSAWTKRPQPYVARPIRRSPLLASVLIALALLLSQPKQAVASPEWLDDFWRQVDDWGKQLDDALTRVEAKAEEARKKLDTAMQARLDELKQVLNDERDALKAAIAEQKKEWAAVITKRLEQVTKEARALADDLDAIVSGTSRAIRGDVNRLSTGIRAQVLAGMIEAKVIVSETKLVDGNLVAQAKGGLQSTLARWGFILLVVLGAMVITVGVPLSLKASKLLTLWVAMVGLGVAGFGGYRLYKGRQGNVAQVPVGITECPMLAQAQDFLSHTPRAINPAARAQADGIRRGLARCQALAADDTLAQLAASHLKRLRTTLGEN